MSPTNPMNFWNSSRTVEYFASKSVDPRVLKTAKDVVKDNKTVSVLDVGAGGGRHLKYFLDDERFDVYGCDNSDSMVNHLVRTYGSKRIQHCNVQKLTYEDSTFDYVICLGVLHHLIGLEDFDTAVKELSRVMKRGALLEFNVFTNQIVDPRLKILSKEPLLCETREGVSMMLLSPSKIYDSFERNGLHHTDVPVEERSDQLTGPRSILRMTVRKA